MSWSWPQDAPCLLSCHRGSRYPRSALGPPVAGVGWDVFHINLTYKPVRAPVRLMHGVLSVFQDFKDVLGEVGRALPCWGRMWRVRGMFPGCSLPSDGLGQSLGQAQNETPEVLDGFIRLCCSHGPRVSAQGQSDPCWFLLAPGTGTWELLLPSIAMQPAKCQSITK